MHTSHMHDSFLFLFSVVNLFAELYKYVLL